MTILARLSAVVFVMVAGAASYLAVLAYEDVQPDLGLTFALIAAVCLAIAGVLIRLVGWTDGRDLDAELARRFRQQARFAELEAERARIDGRRSDVLVMNVQRQTWNAAAEHAEGARG